MNGLEEYRLVCQIKVRFRDLDALQHVNNAVYLSYLEEARVEYLRVVFNQVKPADYAIIVARCEIDYRSAATMENDLAVGARVTRLGGASIHMDYKIVDRKTGRLIAEAKTVLVGFNHKEKRVSKIPAEWAQKMRDYDGVA